MFWLPQTPNANSGCYHHDGTAGGQSGGMVREHKRAKNQKISTLSWVYQKFPLYSLSQNERAYAHLYSNTHFQLSHVLSSGCGIPGALREGGLVMGSVVLQALIFFPNPPAVFFWRSTHSQLKLVEELRWQVADPPYRKPVQLVLLKLILSPHRGLQTHNSEIQEPHIPPTEPAKYPPTSAFNIRKRNEIILTFFSHYHTFQLQ